MTGLSQIGVVLNPLGIAATIIAGINSHLCYRRSAILWRNGMSDSADQPQAHEGEFSTFSCFSLQNARPSHAAKEERSSVRMTN